LSGVKPLGTWQWQFKAFWLYGAVEPTTKEQFFLQFSHVDRDCYQRFLNEFSATYANTLNILQVDNGAFHKACIFNHSQQYHPLVPTGLLS
jgi:hypothetical protein